MQKLSTCAEGENLTTSIRYRSLRFGNPSVSILPPRENSRFPDPFPRSSLSFADTVQKKIATANISLAFSFICAEGETRTLTPCDTRF